MTLCLRRHVFVHQLPIRSCVLGATTKHINDLSTLSTRFKPVVCQNDPRRFICGKTREGYEYIPRMYSKKYLLHQSFRRALHQTPPNKNKLWTITDPMTDPITVLNESSTEPLIPHSDQLFQPGADDISSAQNFFKNTSKNDKIVPAKGVVDLKNLPVTNYPEIAFLGKSNVGKSSLINSIFTSRTVKASVSKKPGHTRVLKFYHVGGTFSLVDMPGYGHNMPEYFVESMEEYLKTRKQLAKVFLLIDGKTGITPNDQTAIEMMEEFSKPYVVVFTKIDKARPSYVINHLMSVRRLVSQKQIHCCFPQPFLTSSPNMWGIGMLQAFITYITGAHEFSSIK